MSLIARMIQAGAPADIIEEVALLLAEKKIADAAIQTRRENDRARQNRRRGVHVELIDAQTDNVMSRDITGHNVTERDPSLPRPLSPQTPLTPTPTHPDNNTRTRKGTGTTAKPNGVSDQTWADFQDLRRKKRAPITPTAINGIESEARKVGWTMEAALAKCVARGWQGFEAGWVQGEAPPQTPGMPANDPLMRSIMAMKAREATG